MGPLAKSAGALIELAAGLYSQWFPQRERLHHGTQRIKLHFDQV